MAGQLEEPVSDASEYAFGSDTRCCGRGRAEGARSAKKTGCQQGYDGHRTR